MKRIQAFVLALTMALTLAFSAVPMGASAANVTLPDGFTFYDTAYSPSKGIYLALAKSKTNESTKLDPTKIYKSTDGINWELAKDFETGYNANRQSRQNLVWWDAADAFIFAGGDKVYSSPDGLTWTLRDDKGQGITRSNATITTDGEYLHVVGGRASKIATNGAQLTQTVPHQCFDAASVYPTASGMSTADASGKRRYMAMTQWLIWTYDEASTPTAGADFANITKTNFTLTGTPVDTIYDSVTEKWIVIDSSSDMYAIGKDNAVSKIQNAANGSNITAIGASEDMALIGTADGGLYAASAQNGITADTQWTAAVVGGNEMTDGVRSISATRDGQFLIATESKLYLGEKRGANIVYTDIDNYNKLGTPTVIAGGDPFVGTQILGGAYSPVLDMYMVYGNTADAGKIYVSEDGIAWTKVCDSQVKFNTDSRNASVWWDKALIEEGNSVGAFVISTKDSGNYWYSKDGLAWSYNESGSFCINGDIVVAGDYLYSPYDVGQYSKLSSLNGENNIERVKIGDGLPAFRQLAVSDDEKYVFLATNYGSAKVYDTEAKTAVDANDGPAGVGDKIVDAKWNSQLGYFIGVHSTDPMIAGMGAVNMQRELTIRPFGTGVPVFTAFDSNGSGYLFGRADGSIYATNTVTLQGNPNMTPFTKVSALSGVDNTLKITDVFAGKNGQYLVTASDATSSEVLLVAANGSSYTKASEGAPATEADLYEGNTITVKVNYVNNSGNAISFKMITAIYNEDNQIIQTEISDQEMAAEQAEVLTQDITLQAGVNSNCTMKVMMWSDMDSLRPISDSTPFFQ